MCIRDRCLLCVRPENLTLSPAEPLANAITGIVRDVLWQGELTHLVLDVAGVEVRVVATRLQRMPERGAAMTMYFSPEDCSLITDDGDV